MKQYNNGAFYVIDVHFVSFIIVLIIMGHSDSNCQ